MNIKNIENIKNNDFHCVNEIKVTGEITENLELSHTIDNIKFYRTTIKTKRQSGTEDLIPVIINEALLSKYEQNDKLTKGKRVSINGIIKSFNKRLSPEINPETGRYNSKLLINVYITKISNADISEPDKNEVTLKGYLANTPTYRQTPANKNICDIMIATNMPYRKSYYIPTICWERTAKKISHKKPGTKLKIKGRLQSRCYVKTNTETNEITEHITYEVSTIYSKEID